MISPYQHSTEHLPADLPSIERIDPETYHFPAYSEGGAKNNQNQQGAYCVLAEAYRDFPVRRKAEARTCIHNAHQWNIDYLLPEKGHHTAKDTAHSAGVYGAWLMTRMHRREGKEGRLLRAAQTVIEKYGPHALEALARYAGWGHEARIIGRALSSVAACHMQRLAEEPGWQIKPDEVFIHWIDATIGLLDPADDSNRLNLTNPTSSGWHEVNGTDIFVARIGHGGEPDLKRGEPWKITPWQTFSVLPYGILEAWPILSDGARKVAVRVLRALKKMARVVTGFSCFGAGHAVPLLSADGKTLRRIQVVTESRAEHSYSFRWLRDDARPMRGVAAFQPQCLPLRKEIQEAIDGA